MFSIVFSRLCSDSVVSEKLFYEISFLPRGIEPTVLPGYWTLLLILREYFSLDLIGMFQL